MKRFYMMLAAIMMIMALAYVSMQYSGLEDESKIGTSSSKTGITSAVIYEKAGFEKESDWLNTDKTVAREHITTENPSRKAFSVVVEVVEE